MSTPDQPTGPHPIGLAPGHRRPDEHVVAAGYGIPVLAIVPYTDGHHHQVEALAGEWTSRMVHLRWIQHGQLHDVWVWAVAVNRKPHKKWPPATEDPDLVAYRPQSAQRAQVQRPLHRART